MEKDQVNSTYRPYADFLRERAEMGDDLGGVFVPAGIGSGDSIQIIENEWADDGGPLWTIAIHNDLGGSEAVSYVDLESLVMLRDAIQAKIVTRQAYLAERIGQ